MKRNLAFIFIIIFLVILLGFAAPVAAIDMTINLDKTYQFKMTNVQTIKAIDLGDLDVSRVELLSTGISSPGDGDDLQTIRTPVFRNIVRNFTNTTGTFAGMTVTFTGPNPSTVSWLTRPDFKIYNHTVVPTFRLNVPTKIGNPVVIKYNESWAKGTTSQIDSLILASDVGYLYNNNGIAHVNATNNIYTIDGAFTDYNRSDINYTLIRNKVALNNYDVPVANSFSMQDNNPNTLANTGKYYAGAIEHDETAKTTTIYALTPLVVLKAPTIIRWFNQSAGPNTLPMTYVKDDPANEYVQMDFGGPNPDVATIQNVTYLIINDTVQYDILMNVDTYLLAKNASNYWQTSMTPGTHIIDLLYYGIQNDFGIPLNYTMTAVGYTTPPDANQWSKIAITPGFGISGNATAGVIQIPALNMSTLNEGLYDVILMGTDGKNDIVALDQGQLLVTSSGGGATTGAITVNFFDEKGIPVQAQDIQLSNATLWTSLNQTNVQTYTFSGLRAGTTSTDPAGIYQLNAINSSASFNVTANVSAIIGQNRILNINLSNWSAIPITPQTQPYVYASEEGTTVHNFPVFFNYSRATLSGQINYTMRVQGNDRVRIAVPVMMKVLGHAAHDPLGIFANVTSSDELVTFQEMEYTVVNGSWTYNLLPKTYAVLNATLLLRVPPNSNGKFINVTLWGTKLGDADSNDVINTGDVLQIKRLTLNKQQTITGYDEADINRDGFINTGDILGLKRYALLKVGPDY